jgi:Icc-related predicted phosphoesterase
MPAGQCGREQKMQFDLTSDLHLAYGGLEYLRTAPNPGSTVLVIAGDCIEVDVLKSSSPTCKSVVEYLRSLNDAYELIIMVLGNHEHFANSFPHTLPNMRTQLARHGLANFRVLEKETFEYQDVIFFGATLWTTFRNRNPISIGNAQCGMNDYRYIHVGNKHLNTLLIPEDTARQCEITKHKLQKFIDVQTPLKKILITHHAPSAQSLADHRYRSDVDDAYYEELFEMLVDSDIKVACHGHIHQACKYYMGNTLVLSNPRGYVGHESQALNHKFLKVEI